MTLTVRIAYIGRVCFRDFFLLVSFSHHKKTVRVKEKHMKKKGHLTSFPHRLSIVLHRNVYTSDFRLRFRGDFRLWSAVALLARRSAMEGSVYFSHWRVISIVSCRPSQESLHRRTRCSPDRRIGSFHWMKATNVWAAL